MAIRPWHSFPPWKTHFLAKMAAISSNHTLSRPFSLDLSEGYRGPTPLLLSPQPAVARELQQKLLLMAPVRDMPDMARQVMAIRPWHGFPPWKTHFLAKMAPISSNYTLSIPFLFDLSVGYRGPTPLSAQT